MASAKSSSARPVGPERRPNGRPTAQSVALRAAGGGIVSDVERGDDGASWAVEVRRPGRATVQVLLGSGLRVIAIRDDRHEDLPAARRAGADGVRRPQQAARTAASGVYRYVGAGMLSPAARGDRPLVYVPNSESGTVDVIDQRTYRIVRRLDVGALPEHVTPSYDLETLYVLNAVGNSLTALDARTGRVRRTIPVDDPYNLYFSPGGRRAIVVAERNRRLDFRDPRSFRLERSLAVPCAGVNHMDFTADGRWALASCEFSSRLLRIDVRRERVAGVLVLAGGRASPQDVKLSPGGRLFYVADKALNGLWRVDARRFRVVGFLRTGLGTHGLYASRDGRFLYATNRAEGTISVLSFRRRRAVATWRIPGGGSPDMGGVSADGSVLWLSGRWSGFVYALSTRDGRLLRRIAVGSSPHGLAVWPQPGRYSLGHTGILR